MKLVLYTALVLFPVAVVAGEGDDLETIPESSTQGWNIFSTTGDYLTRIIDPIKFTVYKSAEKALKQVEDIAGNMLSTIRDYWTNVIDTVKSTAYKSAEKVYRKVEDIAGNVYQAVGKFAEEVRKVFREEFDNIIELLWETTFRRDHETGESSLYTLYDYIRDNFFNVCV